MNSGEVLTRRRASSRTCQRVTIHVRTNARLRTVRLRRTAQVRVICLHQKHVYDGVHLESKRTRVSLSFFYSLTNLLN